jgi:hypothetical protein
MSRTDTRRRLLVAAALLACCTGRGAAADVATPLNEVTARMRHEGRSQAEIEAFLAQEVPRRGIREYVVLYRQDHDPGRLRAIAGLHPPAALVMEEIWPLLDEPLGDEAFASVLAVINEGNQASVIPKDERQRVWASLEKTDANVRQQLLRMLRAFGPFTAAQTARLAELTRDPADYVRAEAVKTLAAWPDSPGVTDALRAAVPADDEAALLATNALVAQTAPDGGLAPAKLAAALDSGEFIAALAKVRTLDDRAFLRQALHTLPDTKARLTCRAWFLQEIAVRKLRDGDLTVKVLAYTGEDLPAYLTALSGGYLHQFGTSEVGTQTALSALLTSGDAGIAYWTCQVLLRDGASSGFAIPVVDRQLPLLVGRQVHVFNAFLDLIERNPQAGGLVQKTLTALVRENAPFYAGQPKMSVAFLRARTLDVLAKVADPSGASQVIADLVINGDQPEEQVAALRALARLPEPQRSAILPRLGRFFEPAFVDRIIDGADIRHREMRFSLVPARNTTPRIEAIRTLMACGPVWVQTYRPALEQRAADPIDAQRGRLLVKDYPVLAAEALATAK